MDSLSINKLKLNKIKKQNNIILFDLKNKYKLLCIFFFYNKI